MVQQCLTVPGTFPGAVQKTISLVHYSFYLVLDRLTQLVGVVNKAHALLTSSASHLHSQCHLQRQSSYWSHDVSLLQGIPWPGLCSDVSALSLRYCSCNHVLIMTAVLAVSWLSMWCELAVADS